MSGGGGGGSSTPTSVAPPDGVNNPFTTPGTGGGFFFAPPPPPQRGSLNSLGGGGRTYFQQRPDVAAAYNQNSQGMSPTAFAQQHFQQFGQFEGNVSDPSQQFYQPVYQPQYQNYAMTNPMGVSQYGQGFGGFNPYAMQMQTPFNPYTNSYGYGMQSPFAYQQPMQQMAQPVIRSSGPAQPIVSRSAGVRGTPNVMMRRAEGGIASLVDDE